MHVILLLFGKLRKIMLYTMIRHLARLHMIVRGVRACLEVREILEILERLEPRVLAAQVLQGGPDLWVPQDIRDPQDLGAQVLQGRQDLQDLRVLQDIRDPQDLAAQVLQG